MIIIKTMKEIEDNEIRIIGGNPNQKGHPRHKRHFGWWLCGFLAVIIIVAGIVLFAVSGASIAPNQDIVEGVFEPEEQPAQPRPLRKWIADGDTITVRGTLVYDTIVNDIPLRLMRPLHTTPHLAVGYDCLRDTADIVLLFQAADVRRDNHKIVGAFVLQGKPLSWGLSKRGYCAIIDSTVTIGVADNSPLFEKATERNGDFFRQYPLVDRGQLVENELKTKSVRRALCEVEGCVIVAETITRESMHDFAQALVDIGVANAIYLTGSTSIGWYMDINGTATHTQEGDWQTQIYKNVSFIVWQ